MKTLIVTGGSVDTIFMKSFMMHNTYDYIIGVDKGVEYLHNLQLMPNLVMGDFDSANSKVLQQYLNNDKVTVERFIAEKDETDTHLAIIEAINKGSNEIDIIGGIGSRIDHTLANINVLMIPLEKGIKCRLINRNNIISLINSNINLEKNDYNYISLIPLTSQVMGITTSGLKYELNGYNMEQGVSIGVSNEFKKDVDYVEITIKKGILIILRARD